MPITSWTGTLGLRTRRVSGSHINFFWTWKWPGYQGNAVIKVSAAALHGKIEYGRVQTETTFSSGQALVTLQNACATAFRASFRTVQLSPGFQRSWLINEKGAAFNPAWAIFGKPYLVTPPGEWHISIGVAPAAFPAGNLYYRAETQYWWNNKWWTNDFEALTQQQPSHGLWFVRGYETPFRAVIFIHQDDEWGDILCAISIRLP